MKINDFTRITQLDSDTVLLVDSANGTKTILAKDIVLEMLHMVSPESHFTIFRGKNLGSNPTDQQYYAIEDKTYKDLFLGDYWSNGGVTYRIADDNYWYNCGDPQLKKPHLIIVPDAPMYNHVMNNEHVTTGGYVNSKMYTEGLTQAKNTIANVFGEHVINHREYLTNAVSNGRPSGGGWFDSTVELMNENMLYGSKIFSPVSDGSNVPTNYTIDKSQLKLFRARPDMICNGASFWLRDVVSATVFAFASWYGYADYGSAGLSLGVRPVFGIG